MNDHLFQFHLFWQLSPFHIERVHAVQTVLIMNDWGVHTDLGEVVGVDGKVEEDIGEDELEG